MSDSFDTGVDFSLTREVSHTEAAHFYDAPERTTVEAAAAAVERPSVIISLSPEAKAAVQGVRADAVERSQREAIRGAKEIAAAAGVSEAQAVQAAQPTRSPPPAKGAALFQANLTAEKPTTSSE